MNATIFVPGGAKGVAVKLNSPSTYAWADNLGFVLEDRKRFIVMFVCNISLSHSESGKFGSAHANEALRFFLNVYIVCSAGLLRCFYGGTS